MAVRSSATAEDLPELSFAGLQDTFLNIIDPQALQDAVVACWSSLWTAEAIGYRNHNQIHHQSVSMCVVIQKMVQSSHRLSLQQIPNLLQDHRRLTFEPLYFYYKIQLSN